MWSTNVFDTYKEYVDGKTSSSTTGFGIDMGPVVSGEYNSKEKEKESDSRYVDIQWNFQMHLSFVSNCIRRVKYEGSAI